VGARFWILSLVESYISSSWTAETLSLLTWALMFNERAWLSRSEVGGGEALRVTVLVVEEGDAEGEGGVDGKGEETG